MSEPTNARILCVGITPCLQRTLQFVRLQTGKVNRARAVTVSSGGKSINVARTLKALNDHPLVTGFAGGDTGSAMIAFLQGLGIECDFVHTDLPTRICTTLVDESTGSVTELVEEAALPAVDEWKALDDKLVGLFPRCGIIVAAGAPPPGAPDEVYARLAQNAARSGVALLIDSRGPPLTHALPYSPLLVKLNHLELAEMCQRPLHPKDELLAAARALVTRGAQWVLVTRGAEPAWLLNATEVYRFTPPAVRVLNGVGSGDATTGGIASALCRGASMPEAVHQGIACGTANALTLTPGDVEVAVVERLLSEVSVVQGLAE